VSLYEENAEVLLYHQNAGADLSRVKLVDFSHMFPDERAAHDFLEKCRGLGFRATVSEMEARADEYDVTVSREMVPTCENITETEKELASIAKGFGGYPDGWGFLDD
jgi:hypothetical protein